MNLTRRLLWIIVVAQVTAWAVFSAHGHVSVTGFFRAFDTHSRQTLREGIDKGLDEIGMRLHGETRFWMADNTVIGATGLEQLSKPDTFPGRTLREAGAIALLDANGRHGMDCQPR